MKNNIITGMVSGLYLFTCVAQAQNYSEKEMALAYTKAEKNIPAVMDNTGSDNSSENTGIVDYPTLSYPETAGFTVEKEKAMYHLSWQVLVRENLSYTEVQASADGVNFSTVGFVMNDGSDYFVPSDKTNNMSYFRVIQHSVNSQKHTSEVMKIK